MERKRKRSTRRKKRSSTSSEDRASKCFTVRVACIINKTLDTEIMLLLLFCCDCIYYLYIVPFINCPHRITGNMPFGYCLFRPVHICTCIVINYIVCVCFYFVTVVIPQVKPLGSSHNKPVLVFINPKSGGNQGGKILQTLQWFLNPRQVFDLSLRGPEFG